MSVSKLVNVNVPNIRWSHLKNIIFEEQQCSYISIFRWFLTYSRDSNLVRWKSIQFSLLLSFVFFSNLFASKIFFQKNSSFIPTKCSIWLRYISLDINIIIKIMIKEVSKSWVCPLSKSTEKDPLIFMLANIF